jgi:hypothetical protein
MAPLSTGYFRWDEKAGLRRDALSSQVIDALEAGAINFDLILGDYASSEVGKAV